nr:vitamin K epoxide reductase family protein [uncultured Dyadobacter sp.]
MMSLLSALSRRDNVVESVTHVVKLNNIRISTGTIESDLQNHPDYPTMLAVSDVLNAYHIKNISIKTNVEKLPQMPTPFLVPLFINSNDEKLVVVLNTGENSIEYIHPESLKKISADITHFQSKWTSRTLMLIDTDEAKPEKDYDQKKRQEKTDYFQKSALILSLPAVTLAACSAAVLTHGWDVSWLPVAFTLLTLAGLVTCGLLIWYELDQFNPVAQKICKASKKVNCSAVLNSKAARIAGVGWSSIGFVYFAGSNLLLLLNGPTSPASLSALAWLNALALPYTVFSVYYQWRIAKQWCILCLSVQAILFLQGIAALYGGWHATFPVQTVWTMPFMMIVVVSFLLPALALAFLIPAYRQLKTGKRDKTELNRLKHSSQIFEALLSRQKTVTEDPNGLGIELGNPAAKHRIIKVCNPYCGPCAEAHAPMEELVRNNPDISVRIIFTASNAAGDVAAQPVRHFLAIGEKYGPDTLHHALDDWYTAPHKDYDRFAAQYAVNGELARQDHKIDAMRAWCDATHISFTPTFFVNGHQLPEIYAASDLKYFLSE